MEQLKVWFADFWPEWPDEDFITPILSKHFEIVLDKNNPDVVFHSIFNRMSETPKYKCKKILYLGENWRPEQFGSDYSISFDPTTSTNYRLPLWQVYLMKKPELKERLFNRLNWEENQFVKWCAFTVSNPANLIRISAFQQLNEYKHVESYGRVLMNNRGIHEYSQGRYWRDAKDEYFLRNPHKFMMTYENTPYRYYCTEKLMDAFLVGSMPIYYGDPRVGEDWNTEAFLNLTKGGFPEAVKKLDQDPIAFREMYQQPVFTEEQKYKHEANMINFESWLIDKVKR